jgi:hypothetical protein
LKLGRLPIIQNAAQSNDYGSAATGPSAQFRGDSVHRDGDNALELTYKNPSGRVSNEVLYRSDEGRLEVAENERPWSFDGDGKLFRVVAEAHRIRLAHLFDPVLDTLTAVGDPRTIQFGVRVAF